MTDPRGPATWGDRWRGWRNRRLASPAFQRLMLDLPGLHWIARGRVRGLYDIVAGFVYAQVLAACEDLDLFTRLAAGPERPETLATACDLPPPAMLTLLKAAASLRLLEPWSGGRWGLGPEGAALQANPGLRAMIAHHALFYADLADPVALLRGTTRPALRAYWTYADRPEAARTAGDAAVAPYSRLMAATNALLARDLLDAYPFARHRCLLEVGAGEAAFAEAAARAHPDLAFLLVDLPAVAARAESRLAAGGFGPPRIRCVGADARSDPLPQEADLAALIRVLHDHDDVPALAILRAIRAALPSGGRLLIAEPMAGTPGAEPAGDAYFGLYLHAMGSGRPRRPAEIIAMAREAGFARARLRPTRNPLVMRLIIAEV